MRRLMLLAVAILTVVSMTVSPALADDRDKDGCDEDIWWCDKFDHGFDSFHHDFVWWPWWSWGHHEVCWWEWSWVFERWELECD